MHHSDEHVTAVTGQLHHPLEIVVGGDVFLLFLYVVLGVPVVVAVSTGWRTRSRMPFRTPISPCRVASTDGCAGSS